MNNNKNISLPRILITGAGGDTAIGVIKALRKARNNYVICAVCINEKSIGLKMADYQAVVPPVSDVNNYISSLIELINKWSVDILIPTVDSEITTISEFHNKFKKKTSCKVIIGKYSDIVICSNKQATSKYLDSVEISHPKIFTSEEEVSLSFENGMDIIVKP